MKIRLTNSLSGAKEVFIPANPARLTLYVCGPTVYARAHIGNFRPVVTFDLLARLLRTVYGPDALVYASNITDVDDKIIAEAHRSGLRPPELAAGFEKTYLEDVARLGAFPPDKQPRATEYIGAMIAMIRAIEAKGATYVRPSGLLMRIAAIPDYGRLGGRDTADMLAGARIAPSPDKEDPGDFYLWKASNRTDPPDSIWDSPWGKGRPGWHIECSAMAADVLGEEIDIHGGGIDLQFPHHENERAQSECAHGRPMARYWLHNGHVHFGADKMSKSAGNIRTLPDLENRSGADAETLRLCLMSAHYRKPLHWTDQLVDENRRRLDRLRLARDRVAECAVPGPARDKGVIEALADDLNTPRALAHLSRLAENAHRAADSGDTDAMAAAHGELTAAGRMLGLLEKRQGIFAETGRIEALLAERTAARARKDWAESDRLRVLLSDMGVQVMDGADTTRWQRK